jgi:AGCS family alanine or glycine:cation symporter
MVHSSSNVKEPVRQGMWGIFEVFADTIVVCTITALTILSVPGIFNLETGKKITEAADSALMGKAFESMFGAVGPMFVAIAIFFFAYSTVLGWSHYGTKAWEYLFGTGSVVVYRVIFVVMVLAGAILNASLAWDLSDTFNGLMMIPNLIGVLVLCPLVVKCTKNYIDRRILKKEGVVPMLSVIPEVQESQLAEMEAEEAENA